MARLRGNGNKLNRAQSIISQIGKNPDDDKPVLPPVDGKPVEDTQPVEAPVKDAPPVNDTPPVDAPVKDAPPVEEPIQQPPALAEVSDDVILSKLSETLGRKIESYDDLKPKEIAVDPELKQLIEWKEKTGLSLTQFADYTKDYSKMSDMDVAREILSEKYPNLNKEELQYVMDDLVYNEDVDDDKDRLRKSIELKKLATEGRQSLEKHKLELKPVQNEGLTKEQQEAINYANTMKTASAQAENNQKAYESKLNLAARNLNTLPLNLEEGVVIDHKIQDSDKNSLKDYILNPPHWFNQDGSPNHENIAKDGYKIKNFDSLLKAAYEQGKAVQLEQSIKGKGNIQLSAQDKPQNQGDEKKGNIHSVVEKLSGSNQSKFRFRRNK